VGKFAWESACPTAIFDFPGQAQSLVSNPDLVLYTLVIHLISASINPVNQIHPVIMPQTQVDKGWVALVIDQGPFH
jgi:hypothetical protein